MVPEVLNFVNMVKKIMFRNSTLDLFMCYIELSLSSFLFMVEVKGNPWAEEALTLVMKAFTSLVPGYGTRRVYKLNCYCLKHNKVHFTLGMCQTF